MKSRARGAQLGVALLCAVAALSWTPRAAAFCRAMSCAIGEDPDHLCQRDANQCVIEGNPVHWASACLSYSVQIDGSPRSKLTAEQIHPIAEQAFSAWKSVHCPGGGSPSFEVQFQGYVRCDRQDVVCDGSDKNANVVMFHDSGWLNGSKRIGLTTYTGGHESGLLIDADVEINSQYYSYESDSSGMMSTSLLTILAHEFGHFLGLAHSRVPGSLMSEIYESVPFSRSPISADDAAAICAAYPPGPSLSCSPRSTPTYDECQIPVGKQPPCKLSSLTQDGLSCSCRLAANSRHPSPTLAALGLLLGFLGIRRTRSKQHSVK